MAFLFFMWQFMGLTDSVSLRLHNNNVPKKKKKFIAFLKHFVVKTIPIHMDLHIFAHYMETIVVLFLKLCTLKPIFKRLRFQDRLHFQDLKMLLPCKWTAKTYKYISVFIWKQCCVNVPSIQFNLFTHKLKERRLFLNFEL